MIFHFDLRGMLTTIRRSIIRCTQGASSGECGEVSSNASKYSRRAGWVGRRKEYEHAHGRVMRIKGSCNEERIRAYECGCWCRCGCFGAAALQGRLDVPSFP